MSLKNSDNNLPAKVSDEIEKIVREKAGISLHQDDLTNYATYRQIEDLEKARKILQQAYVEVELLANDMDLFKKSKNPARTMNELIQTKVMIAEKLAALSNATSKLKPKQEQASTPIINIQITTQKSVDDFIEVEVEED
jgi:hypothetical protein